MSQQIALQSMTVDQEQTVDLSFTTKSGAPATVDGAPEWTVVSGDVTITPDETGLSCKISPNTAGSYEVKVTADADLDAGEERFLEASLIGVVGAAEAQSIGVSAVVTDKA